MGLKCSFLGHSYEEAGVEREREEQGSEVVTVVKELEQCARCGTERVVSESTEVTTVVDPEDVDADVGGESGGTVGGGYGGAAGRAVEESAGEYADGAETLDDDAGGGTEGPARRAADERASGRADEAAAAVDELAEEPDEPFEARDPAEEDAEILTDDDEEARDPGEWPDDPVEEDDDKGLEDVSEVEGETPSVDPDLGDSGPEEESLSGITVPEGRIGCTECGFEVDAESSYRDGDPCPECGAWLTTVDE